MLGADLRGTAWSRDGDKLGVAAVSNGLSDDHRRYLALGGKGFLLGDGRLRYGRETSSRPTTPRGCTAALPSRPTSS